MDDTDSLGDGPDLIGSPRRLRRPCLKRPGGGPHCVHDMREHPGVVEHDLPTCCWCGAQWLYDDGEYDVTGDEHGPECGEDIETPLSGDELTFIFS